MWSRAPLFAVPDVASNVALPQPIHRRARVGGFALSFALATSVLASLFATSAAQARTYDLDELIARARRGNPGLAANAVATTRVQAQLSEARRSWLPTGELLSLLAPAPDIKCEADITIPPSPAMNGQPAMPAKRLDLDPSQYCLKTNVKDITLNFKGLFTRTELHLTQPIFTFGKITAATIAAEQGIAASRDHEDGLAADVILNVKKAYYGLKFAREVLETLTDGIGYLDDAQKQIDKELAEGNGGATQIDRLRLKTVRADIDTRVLETQKASDEARAGLRVLLGAEAPADLEVDEAPLAPVNVPPQTVAHFQDAARDARPEVRALNHLVASKRALADLEWRKQYPDLVLLGSATYAYANSITDPQNAFYNDPFNVKSFGLTAALRLPLDLGVRNAKAAQIRADAEEAELRRRDAVGGIAFEVQRAFGALTEAQKRLETVRGGERAAKSWITAVSQNLGAGLAEAKDFSDALIAFFQFRIRSLQAVFDFNVAAATLGRVTGLEVVVPTKASNDDDDSTPAKPAPPAPDAKAAAAPPPTDAAKPPSKPAKTKRPAP